MTETNIGRRRASGRGSANARRRKTSIPAIPTCRSGAATLAQLAIQVHGRADQREVSERLRKVAQRFAARPDLLGVQAEVVRVREHLLERQASFAGPGGA